MGQSVRWHSIVSHSLALQGLITYSELHGKNSVNWTPPSASTISRNTRRVKTIVAAIDEENEEDDEDN